MFDIPWQEGVSFYMLLLCMRDSSYTSPHVGKSSCPISYIRGATSLQLHVTPGYDSILKEPLLNASSLSCLCVSLRSLLYLNEKWIDRKIKNEIQHIHDALKVIELQNICEIYIEMFVSVENFFAFIRKKHIKIRNNGHF